MQNLKINGVPTPYWCVVVDKNTFDFKVFMQRVEYWRGLKDKHEYWSTGEIKLPDGKWELLGCITLSSMDEGVRELARKNEVFELYMDYMNEVFDTFRFRKPHESALSLLQHNQITLTADNKAVVVKKISNN